MLSDDTDVVTVLLVVFFSAACALFVSDFVFFFLLLQYLLLLFQNCDKTRGFRKRAFNIWLAGEGRCSVETASSKVVGDDDVGDGVEHELNVGRVRSAGHVAVDLLGR